MTTAADGTNFTGAVTCYVTGDAGTQTAGSVGSGACTHEGKGFHTYTPSQAETNFDHVAFTFEGTGAITATVQVYTSFPQTGDSFARIGATGSGLTSLATQASVDDVPTATENADALLDRSAGVETGLTPRQWLRLAASALFGKASGLGTTTAVYRDFGDTKDRLTATVDENGNRTAVTRDAT